jgi:hypothetical protein
MTYLTDFLIHLALVASWVQTPDGTNTLTAAICIAALTGASSRTCLLATLVMHMLLIAVL